MCVRAARLRTCNSHENCSTIFHPSRERTRLHSSLISLMLAATNCFNALGADFLNYLEPNEHDNALKNAGRHFVPVIKNFRAHERSQLSCGACFLSSFARNCS
jgi:hypothetical protein